jgi:hypothetical protein
MQNKIPKPQNPKTPKPRRREMERAIIIKLECHL